MFALLLPTGQYGSLLGGSVRCDALSGENVWGTLTGRDLSMPYDEREIIMVVTRVSYCYVLVYIPTLW